MTASGAVMSQMDDSARPVEKTIYISNELGLHARPAAKIAQAAQQFESRITLEYADMTVDAKSILDILTLAAGQGAALVLRCEGMDADSAATELSALFSSMGAPEA